MSWEKNTGLIKIFLKKIAEKELDEITILNLVKGLKLIVEKLRILDTETKISLMDVLKGLSKLRIGSFPIYSIEIIRIYFDETIELTRSVPYDWRLIEFFDKLIRVITITINKAPKSNPLGQIMQMIAENVRMEATLKKLIDKGIIVDVNPLAEIESLEKLKELGLAKSGTRADVIRSFFIKKEDKQAFEETFSQDGIQFILAAIHEEEGEIEYQMITELKASSSLGYLRSKPSQITKTIDDRFRTQLNAHIEMIKIKIEQDSKKTFKSLFEETLSNGEMKYRFGLNFGHLPLGKSTKYAEKINKFNFGFCGISELNDTDQLVDQITIAKSLLRELTSTDRDKQTKKVIEDIIDKLDLEKSIKEELSDILVKKFKSVIGEAQDSPQTWIKLIM